MTVRDTLVQMRQEAERMYAFNSEVPHVQREAKGMINVINAVEKAIEEGSYDELTSDFGTRLRQVRVELHMTQPEAAEYLKHSLKTQQDYENNRKDPGTRRAKEIAESFGVPFLWLIGYGDTFSCKMANVDPDEFC